MTVSKENEQLVEVAAAGNMEPLLKALRAPDAQMSGPAAGAPTQDADYPANDLWLQVANAYGEGKLSEKQFDAAYEAMTSDGNDTEPDNDEDDK